MSEATPKHPLIRHPESTQRVDQRETLERLIGVIALLKELDLSKGISDDAQFGLYCTLVMVQETVEYLNESLVGK